MKQLTCEMCGSTDLMKQDGVFVCQSCGCKYSVEDAKRMMIEGSVDVSGSTVKVDNSAFVQKYLENARRAKIKQDWEEVEKYYNMVEQNDPQNIEAIFYSSFGKVMQSLSDSNRHKRTQVFNTFKKSISIIDDCYDAAKDDEVRPLIQQMSADIIYFRQNRGVPSKNPDVPDEVVLFDLDGNMSIELEAEFITTIENIITKNKKAYLYHILITHYERCIASPNKPSDVPNFKETLMKKMADANKELAALDPTYQPKEVPKPGGCYVATAVYGSYDCPQVWTLRRFRDYTLAETWYGRAFIRTYYAISPTLVKWFGHTEWFKKMWKGKLDRMVANLNADGVEDTPYEDKPW